MYCRLNLSFRNVFILIPLLFNISDFCTQAVSNLLYVACPNAYIASIKTIYMLDYKYININKIIL